MTVLVIGPLGVDTLTLVPPDPDAEPAVFSSDDLAERWGISRQRVHQLRAAKDDDAPRPPQPPLPEGRVLGKRLGQGTMVWTLAQVLEYERRHPERRPKRPSED